MYHERISYPFQQRKLRIKMSKIKSMRFKSGRKLPVIIPGLKLITVRTVDNYTLSTPATASEEQFLGFGKKRSSMIWKNNYYSFVQDSTIKLSIKNLMWMKNPEDDIQNVLMMLSEMYNELTGDQYPQNDRSVNFRQGLKNLSNELYNLIIHLFLVSQELDSGDVEFLKNCPFRRKTGKSSKNRLSFSHLKLIETMETNGLYTVHADNKNRLKSFEKKVDKNGNIVNGGKSEASLVELNYSNIAQFLMRFGLIDLISFSDSTPPPHFRPVYSKNSFLSPPPAAVSSPEYTGRKCGPPPSDSETIKIQLPNQLKLKLTDLGLTFMRTVKYEGNFTTTPVFYSITEKDGNKFKVEHALEDLNDEQNKAVDFIIKKNHFNKMFSLKVNQNEIIQKDLELHIKLSELGIPTIGRMSSTFATISKTFRNRMICEYKNNAESLAEVDLKALYPTLVSEIYGVPEFLDSYKFVMDIIRIKGETDPDYEKKLKRLSKSIINIFISSSAEISMQNEDEAISSETELEDIKNEKQVVGAKILDGIRGQLNKFSYLHDYKKEHAAEGLYKSLTTKYEFLKEMIFDEKWVNILNKHETFIMINIGNVLLEKEIPFLPVYDCMYIPESHLQFAQQLMDNEYNKYIKSLVKRGE